MKQRLLGRRMAKNARIIIESSRDNWEFKRDNDPVSLSEVVFPGSTSWF